MASNHGKKKKKEKDQDPKFGRYMISINGLKKGVLKLLYPSKAPLQTFPHSLISSDLRKIICDVVYEKCFDESEYNRLEEDEQRLFDDLITFCKADNNGGLLLYKHKKYSDKSRDKDVKRFNILRGELMAGNDNPEILKELKTLLFRMMDQNTITRSEYNKIMSKLVALTV
jgi:hypothetical protein